MRIILLAPLFLWYISYTAAPFLPDALKPTINVYLAHVDQAMFHVLPHQLTTFMHSPVLDVVAAIPYTLHIFWPIGFSLWCARHARDQLLPYLNVFGLASFLAVLTELAFPCAPPWYLEKYGFAPASYDLPGDPGGLVRVDEYWQINFYRSTFDKSPLVFGAFPSLHIGWPTILCLFLLFGKVTTSRTKKVLYCSYLLWVIFSVLYLHHHYLVDVVGGMAYAAFAYFLVGPHRKFNSRNVAFQRRITSFMLCVWQQFNLEVDFSSKKILDNPTCDDEEPDGADVVFHAMAGVPTF